MEEKGGQRHDVGLTLAQRREGNPNRAQSIEEVLPEFPLGNQLLEVPVARRHHPHIDLDVVHSPDSTELPLLKEAKELGLKTDRHLANLVQKQCPLVGQFAESPLGALCVSKGATFVPEKLALEQSLVDGGAVEINKWMRAARGLIVEGLRHQLLPGPRLALE